MFRAILLLALVGAGCGKDEVKAEGEKDWDVLRVPLTGKSEECPVWGGSAILKKDGEVMKDAVIHCNLGGELHILKMEDAPDPNHPYYLCSTEITEVTKEMLANSPLCVKAFDRESEMEDFLKG